MSHVPQDRSTRPEIPTRLLVHALVREDGTVDAGELYAVAGLLGMSDQQVRLCVKRLVAEGRFTQDGRGRKAVLRTGGAATTGAVAPDADHVRHAYRQDHGLAPWDGTWHLFAFAVPEERRTARNTLRETLLHLGAAPVHGGLYVAANPIADVVGNQARRLGLLDAVTFLTSTDLRIGEVEEPRRLAAAIWPLDEIALRYERLTGFAETCEDRLSRGADLSGAERLTLAVELAAEFSRAMTPDPLLPPELLPRPWPGSRARGLVRKCWAGLRALPVVEDAPTPLPRLFRLYNEAVALPSGR
ncbi:MULTISPECIES: PaaX family transcriptional regulator C-terminal domain-containing protein [unclassified Streptomyces]|uniref:PaaX family transcriptional regulator C-terminal domain-containing protein n=1 Tax=unclassified Streptomyces TaxID=2593676 RepID=UPI0022370530|nr:PaaX family transcriptional regulator C-terminal domain-containing protein [Streptomyces sp. SHP 1-2]MCW5253582.1 transcriptional regulator [Streptomyces sp. SHP 1-2]